METFAYPERHNPYSQSDAKLAELRKALTGIGGMIVTAELHDGSTVKVADVRPDSVVWALMKVTKSDGEWTDMLCLSMEHDDATMRITTIPNVRLYWTE
jgi:hypothetical protein